MRKLRPLETHKLAQLLGDRARAEAQDSRVFITAICATRFLHWVSLPTANHMTLDESRNSRPLVPYLSGKAIGLHDLGAAFQKQHFRMFWSPSSLRLHGVAWLPEQQAFLSPSVWAGVIFFPTLAELDQHGGRWDPEASRLLVPSFDQGQNRKRCFPSILTAPSLASIPERGLQADLWSRMACIPTQLCHLPAGEPQAVIRPRLVFHFLHP